MVIKHKDWIRIPLFLEELRALFETLTDEELDNIKTIAVRKKLRRRQNGEKKLFNTGTAL